MVGIPDTKHLNEQILKHLQKKALSGISEGGGRCSGDFYSNDTQLWWSWIFYQNIFNTSVTLTNISFCIYLCKVYLTASLEKQLCALHFLFRTQTDNCDLRTSRNKWEMNEKPDLMTPFLFVIDQYMTNYREKATISVVAELCKRNNHERTKEKPLWAYPTADELMPLHRSEQEVTANLSWQ